MSVTRLMNHPMIRTLALASVLFTAPFNISSAERPDMNIVTSEYPPFEYSLDGKVVGSHTKIIREVVEAMGFQPRIEIVPWIRAEARIQSGTADLVYSLTWSPERAKHYLFTDPIDHVQDVLFKHRDAELPGSQLSDLDHMRVGISASYNYAPVFMEWLDQHNGPIIRISHEEPELTGLRMVAHRRIDLFICEISVCSYLIERHAATSPSLRELSIVPGLIGESRPFRAAFSRKHPRAEELRDAFNAELKKITLP